MQADPVRARQAALKSPVDHLLSCSELLLEEAGDFGILDLLAELGAIQASGNRILTFIDNIPQGPDPNEDEPVRPAIAELAAEVTERVRGLLARPGNAPEVEVDLQSMAADADQLLGLLEQTTWIDSMNVVEPVTRPLHGPPSGKVALVTGGTGALGTAVSHALLSTGAMVISTYVVPEEVPVFEATLGSERERFRTVPVDVAAADEVTQLVDQIVREHGRIDVLVNLVGGYAWSMVADTDETLWDEMFAMNLRSAYLCARAVLPHMVERHSGRIVSVAARVAFQGAAGHLAYGASKAGIVTLTQTLADELKDEGITVNCVIPGTMDTAANRASMPKCRSIAVGAHGGRGSSDCVSGVRSGALGDRRGDSRLRSNVLARRGG